MGEFWKLSDCHSLPGEEKSALGICKTNSYMPGLFIKGSLFNHSCNYNVIYTWKDDKNMVFHAARDIHVGEELCITYIDTLRKRSDRQRILQDRYNFVCECVTCEASEEASELSDKKRCELRQTVPMATDPELDPGRGIELL